MLRTAMIRASVLVAVLLPEIAFAGPYDDLMKAHDAFQNAKSWHAEEHFSNGKTVTVEYSAPDRWRVQPNPDFTEVIIGNDVYMVRNGRATKLPVGGDMIRTMIQRLGFSASDDMKDSARDLGMQTIDGRSLHAYSYTANGTPVTLYLGPDSLPVKSVVQDSNTTTIITYSKYNEPISIEAQ
ncbi:MAG TPA: hypothetical protein VMA34_10765 [Terracidiphilus sp.]|nr:hypothetical protein [Terracidiphilus sp.]